MKQWIILIVAGTILFLGGMFEITYLEKTSKYLLTDVSYSKQYINNENIELAKKHYGELEYTWKSLRDSWGIFIDHDEVGGMDETLLAYKSYLDKDDIEESYVKICELERMIKHIVEKQEVKIGNVF